MLAGPNFTLKSTFLQNFDQALSDVSAIPGHLGGSEGHIQVPRKQTIANWRLWYRWAQKIHKMSGLEAAYANSVCEGVSYSVKLTDTASRANVQHRD